VKRKPIKRVLRAAYQALLRLHLRSYENYQPVLGTSGAAPGTRDCEERWHAIEEVLRRHGCRSVVDLGCSEGYYVLQAARSGLGFCLGVDFDLRRVWTCTSQVILNDVPNAAFLISEITPDLADRLPELDAVVFLSVLHHIMYQQGQDYCRDLLTRLRRKMRKVMVFEMGQSDEHLETWAKKMPDMGSDPHAWIADFVRSAGFSRVEKIGEARSYKREVDRALFEVLP
jgi:cyclopropane fatty-acyl-phospholipid synthase-like methyltransferase